MRGRRFVAFVSVALLAGSPAPALAQQRGSDIGGQPTKRKLTKMPRLVKFVEAEYPPAKKAAGVAASVVLTIEIGATGKVTAVSVAESAGADFDAAAAAAAAGFEFEPAEVDDKPAPAKITYRYDFVIAAPEPPAAALAALEGEVRAASTFAPLGGVKVTVSREPAPDGAAPIVKSTTTDAAGRFSLPDLPAGTYAVVVEAPDGTTTTFSETAAPGKTTRVRYDVVLPPPARPSPPDGVDEVEIRGRPRARREVVDYAVRAEQAKKVAGTQGDVLKVVQNLPGVSRPPVASGQIVVWGSAPRDTRVYVDGVDLPALYHGSGLRGTINSDLVASIDLVPGAFGAEYGRGLGGLVRVETRSLPRGTHGYVGADTLDGSAFASTQIGERVRVGSAFRYSWLDRVLAAASPSSPGGASDIGDFFPIPRYRDAQLKATIDLRKRESLDTVVLVSSDALDRTVPSPDPAKRRVEATRSGFWRAYARYTNTTDDGDTAIVTPFVGHDASSLVQRFGANPTRLEVDSDRYGLRASLRSKLGSRVVLVTGMDALGTASSVSREGSLTLPPREGDVAVFGQPAGDEYAVDRWKTHILDVGPHAYADVRVGPVTLTPGVRFDAFVIEGSKSLPPAGNVPPIGFSRMETTVAPRASARWDVTRRLALTTAYGNYHQPPEPEDLSAVFGTPELGLSRSTHITAGESLRVTDSLTVDVVAFDKRMKDLVVRSRLANPLRARSLTQNGEGRSYGVQLLLRQELWRGFFGWASYAISKSERRFEGDEEWRPFDFDQPHVLSLVASQEIGSWSVGARFRYASGNPRTPVIGSVYDARSDRFDPVFGPQSTTRIPSFWQLDLRVDRTFVLGRGVRALVFADLQNVTNRDNAEEIAYSADFRRRGIITGLPFIAVVGGRLEL
ncbi:MAG: TonB-dependent receptor [Labilithrix sp.]|nr:TonB-dependent receptor [Labilithrix sp.]